MLGTYKNGRRRNQGGSHARSEQWTPFNSARAQASPGAYASPASPDIDTSVSAGFLRGARCRQRSPRLRLDQGQLIRCWQAFRHDLARLDLRAHLAYRGLYARAAELLPDRLRRETHERNDLADAPAIQAGRDGSASGIRAELALIGGRTLRATCAVDRRVLNAADKGSVSDVHAAREQAEPGGRHSLVEMASPNLLRVTARTGFVLQLAVN